MISLAGASWLRTPSRRAYRMSPTDTSKLRFASARLWLLLVGIPLILIVGALWALRPHQSLIRAQEVQKAPELDGGVAWLNTGAPIKIHRDLKGKIVILDFWTLCCINCIHTLPDLAKLEKKYEKELVVIGVHSPKFENERNTESIRK